MDILRRNNVHVSGLGEQAMVFVHGLGCDQSMWRRIVQAFSRDYKIVLFDYVGSGKSDMKAYDPDRYSTLQGYANDVIEVCDALRLASCDFGCTLGQQHDLHARGYRETATHWSLGDVVPVTAISQRPARIYGRV